MSALAGGQSLSGESPPESLTTLQVCQLFTLLGEELLLESPVFLAILKESSES
ncbi:hypothetical protein [Helicobacter marmotae]|uniref:hypothetical protein n=1 Tax=Helicobacter marmotae TaxID=152490 RepID=UPI00131576DB|nr:hypothetical protein [Helicobacter marmotae]